jgi:Beta-lactamase
VLCAALLAGCAPTLAPPAQQLTAGLLLGEDDLAAPVTMQAFTPPDAARPPGQAFSGTLRLAGRATGFRVVHDPWNRVGTVGTPLRYLPDIAFDLVTRGNDLIPLEAGVRRSDHPYWEIIVLPGKVWRTASDGGWNRAVLPFALQERAANCTHNGVMTWLYRNDAVSRVAYQVVSETCGYFKADLWGAVAATYQPRDLSAAATAAIATVDAHRKARLPVRTLAQLAADYPGLDATRLGIGDGIPADDISVLGLVVDGIHYRSECPTRQGPHPFCASLPLPSYSTAKSIFAGVALMRLEHRYPGISRRSIASLVPECDASKWRDVTLANALDMATGNFGSRDMMADEDSPAHEAFVFDDRHASKLRFACEHFPRRAAPGTTFVYHTSDTYLLGVAMQRALDERGAGELYETVLRAPIWQPLGLSPELAVVKRTYDDAAQPFTGYGLTLEADDIVRIARWLTRDVGDFTARQHLDPALLDGALQRRDADRGLAAGADSLRYNHGFWAMDVGPSLDCSGAVWTPFMSGVSGITVAMFPNGVIYYYFSDSYVFRWQTGREAANRVRRLCP